MVLAIDVHYREKFAKCVGILFNWEDEFPEKVIIDKVFNISDYEPGQFYKRELPCILKILEHCDLKELDYIIVDGHVYTTPETYGLGGHLWEAINKTLPIIGVAKNEYALNKTMVTELCRGNSKKPLHISVIGMELDKAVEYIKTMKGSFRMPTILQKLDAITKVDTENE